MQNSTDERAHLDHRDASLPPPASKNWKAGYTRFRERESLSIVQNAIDNP